MPSHTRSRSFVVLFLVLAFGVASLLYVVLDSGRSRAAKGDGLVRLRVPAVADAYVASSRPDRNTGPRQRVAARTTEGQHKVTYVKFHVPWQQVDGRTIVSVRLVLSSVTRVHAPVVVRQVTDTSWSESGVTYRNRPAVGDRVAVLGVGRRGRQVVDVSAAVRRPGTYAFALTTPNSWTRFRSAETGRGPRLVVAVQPSTSGSGSTGGSGAAGSVSPRRCWVDFPGQPCPGTMYYGAHTDGGDPRALEAQLGMRLSIHRWYMTAQNKAEAFASRAQEDINADRLPLVSTKVPGSWAAVAAGKYDDWLVARIKALASVNGPVWFCLHHEPRGDGPPADWVRMQQHARDLIDRLAPNVALVGILNGWDFLQRGGNPEAFDHPVGTGVHIMGFDSYNPWAASNGLEWKTPAQTMSPGLTIQSWGYPTLVAETGLHADPGHPGRAASWVRDQYSFGLSHKFLAIAYYHSAHESWDGTWALSGERLTAFRQNLSAATTAHVKG